MPGGLTAHRAGRSREAEVEQLRLVIWAMRRATLRVESHRAYAVGVNPSAYGQGNASLRAADARAGRKTAPSFHLSAGARSGVAPVATPAFGARSGAFPLPSRAGFTPARAAR